MTPMLRPLPNLRVKLEHLGPAGSHKARAARHVIRKAIADGELTPGGSRRIIEKSGGNFGVGLAFEAAKYEIGVDLVIGLSFSPIKRRLCEEFGAKLIGIDLLQQGVQPKEVIASYLDRHRDEYFYSDQFANRENLNAHLKETAPEIAEQIWDDANKYSGITVVLSAGTGAHAAAIQTILQKEFSDVEMVIVEPENCSFREGVFGSHVQQGAAVGVLPPFLDIAKVHRFARVLDGEASEGQSHLARQCGIYPGPTSGANFMLARRIALQQPERLIITMTYDTGEAYLSNSLQDRIQ